MNDRRFVRQRLARLLVGILILNLAGSSLALAQSGPKPSHMTELLPIIIMNPTPTNTPTATPPTPTASTTPPAGTPPTISGVVDNRSAYPGSQVPKDGKLEITFNLSSVAQNLQMPYDPAPPPGVAPGIGVTVNALFSPDNWQTTYTQPAFYYQDFGYAVKEGQDWIYPSGQFAWKVRFAPNAAGTWQYKLAAQDAGGTTQTQSQTFQVVASSSHGFVRVSQTDSRYFEHADGTYFPALGYNMNFDRCSWNDPLTGNQSTFQTMSNNGIQLARVWLSQWSIFGSQDGAWRSPFQGSGYDGLYTAASGEVYPGSDTSLGLVWSTDTTASPGNPCMFLGWMQKAPAVKPNTSYHISVRYRIPQAIPGPNIAGQPYGLVAKLGGWVTDAFTPAGTWRPHQECAYPATLTNQISPGLRVRPITPYVSTASTGWATLEGDFVTDANTTGAGNYLPYLYLALENVNPGPGQGNKAFVDQVEVRENLAGGQRGPSIIGQSSMSRLQYFDQRQSYAFDQVLELARQNGVYLKLAVLEKNEFTQNHFDYNGNPTTSESNDFFYGNWGQMTKVYWLQRAYWRYLQARWGYSPNVHSWELLNEGDPYSGRHYTLADNFAQYMHQFKPNDHLVTTSFWHSFPTLPFWQNASYSHLDYADVHLYIVKNQDITLRVDKPTDGTYITIASPSAYYDTAAETQLLSMQIGARQPYGVGKPVMRGETGFVIGNTDGYDTELWRDSQGIWLHNYIWGQINPGGLIESYWYDDRHIFDPKQGFDHRDLFGKYYNFIKDIPLSNGHYQDATATASPAGLRAWGQKDLVNQRAHLWIANPQHTWKNVVDNVAIPALTGTVTIGGLQPSTHYQVQWWDTYTGTATTVQDLSSNSAGDLTLSISGLTSDTAVKIALASP